jgi:hypothetical protein
VASATTPPPTTMIRMGYETPWRNQDLGVRDRHGTAEIEK